ncbi:hypothetical protein HA466_0134860 [Hirschfeldia incana]|nr:hypothetical protein HA466_0134860 [Hirschfeldia incana]
MKHSYHIASAFMEIKNAELVNLSIGYAFLCCTLLVLAEHCSCPFPWFFWNHHQKADYRKATYTVLIQTNYGKDVRTFTRNVSAIGSLIFIR